MNWFHRHSWSKWQLVKVRCVTEWSAPNTFEHERQERRCTDCGRIQRAELEA